MVECFQDRLFPVQSTHAGSAYCYGHGNTAVVHCSHIACSTKCLQQWTDRSKDMSPYCILPIPLFTGSQLKHQTCQVSSLVSSLHRYLQTICAKLFLLDCSSCNHGKQTRTCRLGHNTDECTEGQVGQFCTSSNNQCTNDLLLFSQMNCCMVE